VAYGVRTSQGNTDRQVDILANKHDRDMVNEGEHTATCWFAKDSRVELVHRPS